MSVLTNECLSLNAAWQPIKVVTVRKAIENMTSNRNGEPPEYGLDVEFGVNPDGSLNYDDVKHVRSVPWDVWITLPIRPGDLFINAGRYRIRVPTLIICSRHKVIPWKEPKLSKRAILERDGYRDQYTGEVLPASKLSIDHVIPRSKGGKNRWENLVACGKVPNRRKGNRFNHEVGMKLISQPTRPKPQPVSFTIKEIKHPSWQRFLLK